MTANILRCRPPPEALAWAARAVGRKARVISVRALSHGGWHANHALEIVDGPGRRHRLVLRRWARPEWIVEDPDFTVEREGDYHPGNTLWSRGRLTGVVDWTQASRGPPAVDVGHMRWNLAADFGEEAADGFLRWHRATDPRSPHDPYWDLVTLMDVLPDLTAPSPAEIERLDGHVASLIAYQA